MPGQTAGTTADITVGLELAFPGKSVAQVKKGLKVTLSSCHSGRDRDRPERHPVELSTLSRGVGQVRPGRRRVSR